jgi:hypothetical protein
MHPGHGGTGQGKSGTDAISEDAMRGEVGTRPGASNPRSGVRIPRHLGGVRVMSESRPHVMVRVRLGRTPVDMVSCQRKRGFSGGDSTPQDRSWQAADAVAPPALMLSRSSWIMGILSMVTA